MATKKQKRALALAKREAFLEEERLLGLKAQEAAQKRRERRRVFKAEHKLGCHGNVPVAGCPECSEIFEHDEYGQIGGDVLV